MKPKPKLDMDKIARTLGAERRGKVESGAGYFGAMQIVAEIQARLALLLERATDQADEKVIEDLTHPKAC